MVKFTIKCLLLASLFFFGVLLGMQKAQEGIQDVKGNGHSQKIEQVADSAQANTRIAVKKEKLKDIQTFNVFSAAGDVTSQAVTGLFQIGVHAASNMIQKMLS